jgi:hypothetical protein
MRARAEARHADTLASEVGNGPDALVPEQLQAADMHPSHHHNRTAAVDPGDQRRGVIRTEIHFSVRECRAGLGARRQFDIADIVKTFGAQQVLNDVLGSTADVSQFRNSHAGHFDRAIRGERRRCAEEACGARERQSGQKMSSGLDYRHLMPSFRRLRLQLAFELV